MTTKELMPTTTDSRVAWTDISLTVAMFCYMVNDNTQPNAIGRRHLDPLVSPQRFNPTLKPHFSHDIIKALPINTHER